MRLLSAAVLSLALLALLAPDAFAQEPPPRSISVSASDTVNVTPDRVIVNFAVVSRAQQPEAVREQNAAASARALDAVRRLNIPDRQIQVQHLHLTEEVEYRQGRRVRIGFIARRGVQVIIDDMELLPAVVAAVVQEGATELGGIEYSVRDRRPHENEALRRAAVRAREKADVLAATLGTSIRAVHAVTESGVSFPQPRPQYGRAMMEMDMAAAPEPDAFAAGEIEVRATLSVIFELE